MSDTPTFQTEPEAPTVATFSRGREIGRPEEFSNSYDIRVKGSTQEKDREEYFADIEHRRQRATEFEARRQNVKPKEIKVELSVLDEVLNAVDAAAENFQQSYGQNSKLRVIRSEGLKTLLLLRKLNYWSCDP
jgi:hypothetical protein